MDLNPGKANTESINWDVEFRKKLSNIWVQLLCMKFGNMDKNTEHFVLKELAIDFFEYFMFSPIPVSLDDYAFRNFSSISVQLEITCFAIPHFLYAVTNSEQYPDLRPIFQLDITYTELLIHIYENAFSIRKHLRESEIKILQFLSNYSLRNNGMHLFMNSYVIAKYTRLDNSTIRKMLQDLMNNRILQSVYAFNPWRLGYVLKIFEYPSEFDKYIQLFWSKWTVLKQPQKDTYVRVIFIPSVHAEDEFVAPDFVKEYTIHKMTLYTDLTQLSKDEKTSFQKIPSFGLKKTLNTHVLTFNDSQGTEWIQLLEQTDKNPIDQQTIGQYRSLKHVDKAKRLEKVLKIFDYLTKHSTPQLSLRYVASKVHLSPSDTSDIFRFIIDQNITDQVLHLKYIGCNVRLVVFIHATDERPIITNPKIQIFLQDVLVFPYNITYIGKNAIVAFLAMPTIWVESFLRYLNLLTLDTSFILQWSQVLALRTLDRHIPYYPDILISLFGAMVSKESMKDTTINI